MRIVFGNLMTAKENGLTKFRKWKKKQIIGRYVAVGRLNNVGLAHTHAHHIRPVSSGPALYRHDNWRISSKVLNDRL